MNRGRNKAQLWTKRGATAVIVCVYLEERVSEDADWLQQNITVMSLCLPSTGNREERKRQKIGEGSNAVNSNSLYIQSYMYMFLVHLNYVHVANIRSQLREAPNVYRMHVHN